MKELNSYRMGIMELNQGTLLVIKIPDSRVLRIVSRSLFFAMFLLTLPSIGSVLRGCSNTVKKSDVKFEPAILNLVKMLFPDFVDEGLIKSGHKGLVVGSNIDDNMLKEINFLNENGIDMIVKSNLDENNESLDFVLGLNFKNTKLIDRVLKTGGIVITQLNNEPLGLVQRLPNYRIVYIRRFQDTVVAMRKIALKDNSLVDPTINLIIQPCGNSQEARKMALKGLEDALLEPPRRALKSKEDGSRTMKFLPNLLGDSLSSYPRRIFLSDEKSGVEDWFHNNYPIRNQYFEVYNLEPQDFNGVSKWLRNNVRQEDFVVLKAEAKVVEEMMKDKAICLIDELFLECKNQWQEGGESKRAYWQCLALYGSLRDQGVAVHQWWS